MPTTFTSMSNQSYERHGSYQPLWNMLLNDPGLSNCSFSFDDQTYSLLPYHRKLSTVNFQKIYLDVNGSWSKEEFEAVINLAKDKEVYVHDQSLVKLSNENKDELWNRLHSRQFSLFPLFDIKKQAESMLITKSTPASPSLDELEGSQFLLKTRSFLGVSPRINLFDLGTVLSPYLKSLKEFRVFQYDRGNMRQLADLLASNYFPDDAEDDDHVIIHRSDMIIQRSKGMQASSGPDHMMRLFSYNHIMQKLGKANFISHDAADSLVDEARKAYVVTPVSSLVVLETQSDYDRFDISDPNASLQNASLHSKGAVPEPHEWAIIIMTIILMAYLTRKRKLHLTK